MVVLKIYDSVNGLDFEIPLSSDDDSPFSLDKSLSDLTELTSRSGVQSRNFKITLSKEIAETYEFFNQAMHHNYKDVDADKEAVILVYGDELERGKVRIINYTNTNNEEEVELLFYGNNYDWKEEIKNLTMADLTWTHNSISYTPQTVKGSWTNSVLNGHDWVFPLENRGGRKLLSMVHTEDFRPAIFLYRFIERALFAIGYTFQSDFFETTDFKRLVITHFGNRFRNTKALVNLNKVILNFTGNTITYEAGYNLNLNYLFNNVEAIVSDVNIGSSLESFNELQDDNNNFNPTAGTVQVKGIYPLQTGQFTAPVNGSYLFKMEVDAIIYSEPLDQNDEPFYTFFLRKYDSLGNTTQSVSGTSQANAFVGTITGSNSTLYLYEIFLSGEIEIELQAGEKVEFWRQYHSGGKAFNSFEFTITNCTVNVDLVDRIIEGNTFNLSDVVDDKVKVIDIINDVSRMFNLFWDADTVLKKITVEPRDDYYNAISTAYDVTEQIDRNAEIKTVFNSSFHKKDLVFKYADDRKDVFVEERNKEKATNLAEYKHTLPNKFQKGTNTISTSVLAATYILRDTDSLDIFKQNKAPYTARYWNSFTKTTPLEILEDHLPRILCYNYEVQNGTRLNGTNAYKFRFYDEQNDRAIIPYVLPHQIKIGGTVIASTSMNLYWHTTNEQDGLFKAYWSKTITEIVSGLKAYLRMWFDNKQWKDFSFRNIAYISEPIDLRGYWIFEKKSNYQPENGGSVNIELLKRIEYEPQTEATTIIEQTPIEATLRVTGGNETAMTIEVFDNNNNLISVNMQTNNDEPLI